MCQPTTCRPQSDRHCDDARIGRAAGLADRLYGMRARAARLADGTSRLSLRMAYRAERMGGLATWLSRAAVGACTDRRAVGHCDPPSSAHRDRHAAAVAAGGRAASVRAAQTLSVAAF